MGRKHTKAYVTERVKHWRRRVKSLEGYLKQRRSPGYSPPPIGSVASRMSIRDYEIELSDAKRTLKYWEKKSGKK